VALKGLATDVQQRCRVRFPALDHGLRINTLINARIFAAHARAVYRRTLLGELLLRRYCW